ncbi:MAG: hypothetical protein KF764_29800 [Labilithrix sp.]|nr:hypothetical protein [Labilithrix sp.]MBX3223478.1 hypothetical protein [Labilithrix sp.]
MSLANLVPAGLKASTEETDVLLELAYLSTAVDGRLDDEELSAFKVLVGRLRGTKPSDSDVDALLDRFAANVDHAEIGERVEKLAPTLPANLRPLAFKLAVGLGVADLDASADESDLQIVLAEALGLDEARVDELTAEVYASLDAGDDS